MAAKSAEDADKDPRTVFIRGVSFDAVEKDLEAAFSEVGPVKQCFLVRVKGQPKHRGFGFVQYALPEDAERAVGELDGTALKGRKLQVELAIKRAPLEERKKKRKGEAEEAAPGNLTPPAIGQAVALARKAGAVEEVMNPAPPEVLREAKLEADGCTGAVVVVIYKTVKDAMAAVSKLHNQVITLAAPGQQQGGKKKGKGKKGGGADADEEAARGEAAQAAQRITLWAREVKGEGAHVKQWRVILRNLPFQITEAALQKALAPVGFVWELKLLRGPDGRVKGFAFAAFTCRAHAEKAIATLNGKELMGRTIVVDWAVSKAQYEAAAKATAKEAGAGKADQDADDDDPDRPGSGSGEGEDDEDQEDGKDGKQQKLEARAKPAAKPTWQGEESHDPDAAAERSRPGSTSRPASSLETTVFVRGLPLDVTQPQLQSRLELFGPVKSCRLVIDKASGKPKGTAFVEYREPEAASKAADACARGRRNEGPGITLAGRPLDVDLALSGDGARSLATQRLAGKAVGKDRRNLYLAKEGGITEGSPAWNAMSPHDQAKRKRAAEEKNIKLKSPNFVISRTRLSVRNIPPGWTEAKLRRLFVDAVKERATKENPRVVQAKILKEENRYEASGARKSKGLGFVEFESHEHALTALRQLNNNPGTAFGRERRPIVEFAIDNVKVLKKIEHLREKAKQNAERQQKQKEERILAEGDANGDKAGKKQRSKKQKGGKGDATDEAEAAEPASGEVAAADGATVKRDKRQERKDRKKEAKGKAGDKEEKGSGAIKGSKRKAVSGEGDADGDGEGEGGMTSRQRKRQRQKERVAHKRQLLKEGGVPALVAEVEAKRSQRAQGGAGAGGNQADGPKDGRRGPKGGKPEAEGEAGAARRKRRSEEQELDRIAEQGLNAKGPRGSGGGGAQHPSKRRRRSEMGEEGDGRADKLDRLVEQYK
eukprot:XP_001699766.1 predicted protein [Chlamydomonas reinhardtii]